jgi:glycosyltransferase involved in cell wall biosynthesis
MRVVSNNTHPLVTIAIPTYNRADSYLKLALESAVKQTYPNIEIIVSDNCSNDNTESVVKSFHDPQIRYFRQNENIGAANNTNFCLSQAVGKYFLLLQDDDLIDNDFVKTCIDAFDNSSDVGVIRTGTRIINSEGKVLLERPNLFKGLSTEDFFKAWFAGKSPLFLCSTLFNTNHLKEIGGFKSKHYLFDDVMAIVQLAAKFGRSDIKDIKASFRNHPDEMTFKVKVNQWCEDSLQLLDLMCEIVPDENKLIIKKEGMRFFSERNYSRAQKVKSPINRFISYAVVFKKFNYQYCPSFNHLLHMTSVYYIFKFFKDILNVRLNYLK